MKTRLEYDALAFRFWGVGSNTPAENEEVYRHQSLAGYVEVSRRVRPCCRVGVRFEAQALRFLDREEEGLLATESYPGLDPSTVAGTVFERDSRDRRYDPRWGFYYQGFALFFDEKIGGDWNFNNYHLDLRHYVPLPGWNHRLATQAFLYAAKGYPPTGGSLPSAGARTAAATGRHAT